MTSSNTAAGGERRPTHRLFAAYLLLTAPALLFPYHRQGWPILLALHLLVALALLRPALRRPVSTWFAARFPRLTQFLADWYLLGLVPALYTELATLNKAVWNGHFFDDLILKWEAMLFGAPSQELALRFNSLPLSEYLHFSYLSYYLIIYTPPLVLWLRGRRSEFRALAFTLMLTFFAHYLFFVYFPVQGPRYLFPAPTGEIAQGTFYQLTHRMLEAGSSQGAAFPSSHVGVAAAQTLMTLTYIRPLGLVLVTLSLSLALGAVYGGFHYATDALFGLVLGVLCVLAGPRLRRVLAR